MTKYEEGILAAKSKVARKFSSDPEWLKGYDSISCSAKLDKWYVTSFATPYSAPETVHPYLSGVVTGHPMKMDGDRITTSPICGLRDGRIVTLNREYELGDPDPEYEKQFPNCKAKLLESLKAHDPETIRGIFKDRYAVE